MLSQVLCNLAAKCSNMRQHVQLQYAQKWGNMSSCNKLNKASTCPSTTCLKRRQYVKLQHSRTGSNMSGCNMLKKAATCPAATCSKRQQHVRLQHVRIGGNMSGYNMLEQAATSCCIYHIYPFLCSPWCHYCHGLLHCRQSLIFFSAVGNIAKIFKHCRQQR